MIGVPRAHYRVTDSTNERAKLLAEAGAPYGTLVTADEQSAGRGRQGRAWSAPPGSSLLLSLIVRNLEERHALLPLAAAVAVCDALPDLDCRIKWPNDVWVDGRKLCGILLEGRPQEGWAVLGIGLNVNLRVEELPEELRETATSVAIASGGERNLDAVRCALTRALGRLDRGAGRRGPRGLAGARRDPRTAHRLGRRRGPRRRHRRLGCAPRGDGRRNRRAECRRNPHFRPKVT